MRDAASAAVTPVLEAVEKEAAEGQGKASAEAAVALRAVLKVHGKHLDTVLDECVHLALTAAGELEGWQRWRADQLREALVAQAEGLLKRPEGQAIGGRKMQETLRSLREQWKQTDQGGAPNHGMWKRFDEACNEAHKVVEVWLDKLKAESAEQIHQEQRKSMASEAQRQEQRLTVAQGELDQAKRDAAQAREEAAALRGRLEALQTVMAQDRPSDPVSDGRKKT